MFYLPSFLRAMRTQVDSLEASIQAQAEIVSECDEQVRRAFVEVKKIDLVLARKAEEVRAKEMHDERIEIDEISQQLWRRASAR
jgi:flagellar export protein FliJ